MTALRTLWLGILAVWGFGFAADNAGWYFEANTQAHEDVELRLLRPGVISALPFGLGQPVETGSVIVQLHDAVERAEAALLAAEMANTLPLESAQVMFAQRKAEYEKLEAAFKKKAVAALEVDRARLEMALAALEVGTAEFAVKQAQRQHHRIQETLE